MNDDREPVIPASLPLLAAAERVLRDAAEPMHVRDLTARMLDSGLWVTAGKTPTATVAARLATELKRRSSIFARTAPGTFGLREWANRPSDPPASRKERTGQARRSRDDNNARGHMSFLAAAEEILGQASGPLHYRDIARRALESGLIKTSGLTPEATMAAQIITDIQRHAKRGDESRFVRTGRGIYDLSARMPKGLARDIQQHNRGVRDALLAKLHAMHPRVFETLVARLLTAMGFDEIADVQHSGDGGIDVRGRLLIGSSIPILMAVQVKRWKANVRSPTVQQVRGSLRAHDQGLIVTTSDFSAGARAEAAVPDAAPVALINGQAFASLLMEYEIGVVRDATSLFELDPDFGLEADPPVLVEQNG